MYTIQQDKIALSPLDDKRHIVTCELCEIGSCETCNFETMAYGHFKLKEQRENGGGTSAGVDGTEPASKRLRMNADGDL